MTTNTEIKTAEQRLSEIQRPVWTGMEIAAARERLKDDERAELRIALEAAQQQLASHEAQMLRMAQCAGEFAKDACKVRPDSGRDAALLNREAFEAAYIAKMQGRWPHQPLDKYDVESFLKRDAKGDYITAYPQWIGWELARASMTARQVKQAPAAKDSPPDNMSAYADSQH